MRKFNFNKVHSLKEAFDFNNEIDNDTDTVIGKDVNKFIKKNLNIVRVLCDMLPTRQIPQLTTKWCEELDTNIAIKSVINPNTGTVNAILTDVIKNFIIYKTYPLYAKSVFHECGIDMKYNEQDIRRAELAFALDNENSQENLESYTRINGISIFKKYFPKDILTKIAYYILGNYAKDDDESQIKKCGSTIWMGISKDKGIFCIMFNDLAQTYNWGKYHLIFGFTGLVDYPEALNQEKIKVTKNVANTPAEKALKKLIKLRGIILSPEYKPVICTDNSLAFVSSDNKARYDENANRVYVANCVRLLTNKCLKKWTSRFHINDPYLIKLRDAAKRKIVNYEPNNTWIRYFAVDRDALLLSFLYFDNNTHTAYHYITTYYNS